MTSPSLLCDEDVRVLLAEVLRQRGYDAVHVSEQGRGGMTDLEQLEYAVEERRAILTHHIRDFVILQRRLGEESRSHFGIIVSDQLPFGELLRRTLRCLSRFTVDDLCNRLVWLHDSK